MKKLKLILFVAICATSCSKDVVNEPTKNDASSSYFSFEDVTEPSKWSTYNSMEEMLEACQIPEEMLSKISTEDLIKICMNHPLGFVYTAYNNEMTGADVVFDNFNGFKELQSRSDKNEKILSFYKNIQLNSGVGSRAFAQDEFSSSVKLGFLELYLASNDNAELYTPKYIGQLNEVIAEKYSEKQKFPENYMMLSLRKSYLLKAKVMLNEKLVNSEDLSTIQEFVESGGAFLNEMQSDKVKSIILK